MNDAGPTSTMNTEKSDLGIDGHANAPIPDVNRLSFDFEGKPVVFALKDRSEAIQRILASRRTFYELDLLLDARGRLESERMSDNANGTVVDVGANIGNHTVFFATVCRHPVVALEPYDANVELLRQNIALNDIGDRVTCLHVAAGAATGRGTTFVPDPKNLGSVQIRPAQDGDVSIVRLDDVLPDRAIALMKIDVEGMEREVLQGGLTRIQYDKPHLYVELKTTEVFDEVHDLLADVGYWLVESFNFTPTFSFTATRPADADRLTARRLGHAHIELMESRVSFNRALRAKDDRYNRLRRRLEQKEGPEADLSWQPGGADQLRELIEESVGVELREVNARTAAMCTKVAELAASARAAAVAPPLEEDRGPRFTIEELALRNPAPPSQLADALERARRAEAELQRIRTSRAFRVARSSRMALPPRRGSLRALRSLARAVLGGRPPMDVPVRILKPHETPASLASETTSDPAMSDPGPALTREAVHVADAYIELAEKPYWITLPARGHRLYRLEGTCAGPDHDKRALVQMEFLTPSGSGATGVIRGLSHSEVVGHYRYIPSAPNPGADFAIELLTPADASAVRLGFRSWSTSERLFLRDAPLLRELHRFVSREEYDAALDEFLDAAARSTSDRVVVLLSSTKSIGHSNRANRPMQFAECLARAGVPTLYSYYRWNELQDITQWDGGPLLQCPVDVTSRRLADIAAADLPGKSKILLLSIADAAGVQHMGVFKEHGWTVVYECRDDWEEFARAGQAKWYSRQFERYAVSTADVVTTVSRPLATKMTLWRNARGGVHVVPNSPSQKFVELDTGSMIEERRASSATRPFTVGYFGHLTSAWFDWHHLGLTANVKPNWHFELIGYDAPSKLNLPENVTLLGSQGHDEIIERARSWDVAMIPFVPGRLAEGVDPIKVYEYLALGLPVVSCLMPQITSYPYVLCYDRPTELPGLLDKASVVTVDPAVVKEFLRSRTWDDRVAATMELADGVLA